MNDCCKLSAPVSSYILVHTSGDKQSKSPNTFFSVGHSKLLAWSTLSSLPTELVDVRAVAIALWSVKDVKPRRKSRYQRRNGIESMRTGPSYMQFMTGF